MGGGPSQAERDATARAQADAERRARLEEQDREVRNQFITLASTPDPLTERLRQRDTQWLDWSEGKQLDVNGNPVPMDVRNAPGLGPALSLYQNAAQEQGAERQGIGALRMGVQGANSDLANLIKEQRQGHREQQAAGALENAVNMREAEVTGSILPLANMQQQQRMGLASLASGNANAMGGLANDSTGQYISSILNRPQRPSFWRTFTQSFGSALGNTLGSPRPPTPTG